MVNVQFCQSCGFKNENSTITIKFCAKCGTPFYQAVGSNKNTGVAAVPLRPVVSHGKPDVENDEDDGQDDDGPVNIPAIEKLDANFTANRPHRQSLNSLIGTGGSNQQTPRERTKGSGKSKSSKKIWAEFREEAGAIRPGKSRKSE